MDYRKTVEHLREKAEIFKKSNYAVDGVVKCFEESADTIEQLAEELKQFKFNQEQGLLIELPVPEGTTVYIFEDDCSGDVCDCNGDCENCASHSKYVDEIEFDCGLLHAWGKWVFATRSEAEEALAKMGGTHEDTY